MENGEFPQQDSTGPSEKIEGRGQPHEHCAGEVCPKQRKQQVQREGRKISP